VGGRGTRIWEEEVLGTGETNVGGRGTRVLVTRIWEEEVLTGYW